METTRTYVLASAVVYPDRPPQPPPPPTGPLEETCPICLEPLRHIEAEGGIRVPIDDRLLFHPSKCRQYHSFHLLCAKSSAKSDVLEKKAAIACPVCRRVYDEREDLGRLLPAERRILLDARVRPVDETSEFDLVVWERYDPEVRYPRDPARRRFSIHQVAGKRYTSSDLPLAAESGGGPPPPPAVVIPPPPPSPPDVDELTEAVDPPPTAADSERLHHHHPLMPVETTPQQHSPTLPATAPAPSPAAAATTTAATPATNITPTSVFREFMQVHLQIPEQQQQQQQQQTPPPRPPVTRPPSGRLVSGRLMEMFHQYRRRRQQQQPSAEPPSPFHQTLDSHDDLMRSLNSFDEGVRRLRLCRVRRRLNFDGPQSPTDGRVTRSRVARINRRRREIQEQQVQPQHPQAHELLSQMETKLRTMREYADNLATDLWNFAFTSEM